jgi:hypothetical protein
MTKRLFAIATLAMALNGCAVEDDALETATDDGVAAPSETDEVEVRGITQALMPAVGASTTLSNTANPTNWQDLRIEHTSNGQRVTSRVTNYSRTRNESVRVKLAISATCKNASGTQQNTYTVTWNSPWIHWQGQNPSTYAAHSPCPTNWTVTSKKTVFTLLEKQVSP